MRGCSARFWEPKFINLHVLFQVLSLLVCILGAYTLVISISSSLSQSDEGQNAPKNGSIHDLLKSWMIRPEHVLEETHRPGSLLNLPDFYFLLNNISICVTNTSSPHPRRPSNPMDTQESPSAVLGSGVYFMIIVHSAPDHFAERQAIRDTWGSVKNVKNWAIRLVFLLGSGQESELSTRKSIFRESAIFGDIVSGNFHDTYRNLTYKHLMGYQWALNYCPGATFILKTDDDAFIDIFQLFEFTSRTYGFNPTDTLVCNVFPEGTKPIRPSDPEAEEAGRKWAVTREEYPFDSYPKYCGGLAYLITPDALERILRLGHQQSSRFFWIDDVYVTGVLRELTGKEPFYLNLRYSYDPEHYREWLDSDDDSRQKKMKKSKKIPFMIVHVERGPGFTQEMSQMWMKTLSAWSSSPS